MLLHISSPSRNLACASIPRRTLLSIFGSIAKVCVTVLEATRMRTVTVSGASAGVPPTSKICPPPGCSVTPRIRSLCTVRALIKEISDPPSARAFTFSSSRYAVTCSRGRNLIRGPWWSPRPRRPRLRRRFPDAGGTRK